MVLKEKAYWPTDLDAMPRKLNCARANSGPTQLALQHSRTHTRTSEHALSRSLLLPKKKWTCYCPAEVGTMQRSRKCYVTAAAVGAEASESTFVYV